MASDKVALTQHAATAALIKGHYRRLFFLPQKLTLRRDDAWIKFSFQPHERSLLWQRLGSPRNETKTAGGNRGRRNCFPPNICSVWKQLRGLVESAPCSPAALPSCISGFPEQLMNSLHANVPRRSISMVTASWGAHRWGDN